MVHVRWRRIARSIFAHPLCISRPAYRRPFPLTPEVRRRRRRIHPSSSSNTFFTSASLVIHPSSFSGANRSQFAGIDRAPCGILRAPILSTARPPRGPPSAAAVCETSCWRTFGSKAVHRALGGVHLKLQPGLQIPADRGHDALPRAAGAHIDVAVIRVPAERMTPAFEFLVQIVQQDVRQAAGRVGLLAESLPIADCTSRPSSAPLAGTGTASLVSDPCERVP